MPPKPKRLPWGRTIERVLGALDAYEALECIAGGAIALALALTIGRTTVLAGRGPAAQNFQTSGVWAFAIFGAILLLGGSLILVGIIRDRRRRDDGKWG